MAQKFSNQAKGKSTTTITTAATSVTLVSDDNIALFPVANTGALASAALFKASSSDWFKLVLKDDNGFEVCYCGTHADGSTTFSDLLRGQDGTTPRQFSNSATVVLSFTADDADTFKEKVSSQNGKLTGARFGTMDLGNVTGTSTNIDLSAATKILMTVTGDFTLNFINPPAASESRVNYLKMTNGGAHTISYPANSKFSGGSAPGLTAAGTDLLAVIYSDTADVYEFYVVGQDVK